jgi:hypothetical protein
MGSSYGQTSEDRSSDAGGRQGPTRLDRHMEQCSSVHQSYWVLTSFGVSRHLENTSFGWLALQDLYWTTEWRNGHGLQADNTCAL